MVIERDNQNIIIKLDASLIDIETVQKFAGYFRVLESNAKNQGTVEQAESLASEAHRDWLKDNQERLSKI